jgi:ABC-type bacteriocin/lantibiotic exporter with double-glycine peptidase domain
MPGRTQSIRLKTRNFKQSRAMCGPACLKIVLAYFGVHRSEKTIAKSCRASHVSGTTGTHLVAGAKRFGFHAELLDQSAFARWKVAAPGSAGHRRLDEPVASCPGRSPMACGHYSIVCGLDKERIFLQDPGLGRCRHLSRKRFLNVRFDFERVSPRVRDDLIIRRLIVAAPTAFTIRHMAYPALHQ